MTANWRDLRDGDPVEVTLTGTVALGRDPADRTNLGTVIRLVTGPDQDDIPLGTYEADNARWRRLDGTPDPGQITPDIARDVLAVLYNDGGGRALRMTDYRRRLLTALGGADGDDLATLALAYPGEVAAVTLSRTPGGMAGLRAIAASDGPF